MNIDRRNDGLSAPQRRAESIGFHACAAGLPREENPYLPPAMGTFVDAQTTEITRLLAEAWWLGWDRAARDIPPSERLPWIE